MYFYNVRVKVNDTGALAHRGAEGASIIRYSVTMKQIKQIVHEYQYSKKCFFGLKRINTTKNIFPKSYETTYISSKYFDCNKKVNLLDLCMNMYVDYQINNYGFVNV
jgi:hypothetical protein